MVNLLIAILIAGVFGVISVPVGVGAFLVFVSVIYLRGYLIPGTPTFTKRYFPDWLLRQFDKHPSSEAASNNFEKIDVEVVLQDAGAVAECDDRDDLCVTPSFASAWRTRIKQLRQKDSTHTDIAAILGVEPEELSFQEHGNAFVVMRNGAHIGQWESHGAVLADITAAHELKERYTDWEHLNIHQQSSILNGLRLFLEQCPSCDGLVTIDQEVVDSCCRSIDVVAATCQDCGARLFEAEHPVG